MIVGILPMLGQMPIYRFCIFLAAYSALNIKGRWLNNFKLIAMGYSFQSCIRGGGTEGSAHFSHFLKTNLEKLRQVTSCTNLSHVTIFRFYQLPVIINRPIIIIVAPNEVGNYRMIGSVCEWVSLCVCVCLSVCLPFSGIVWPRGLLFGTIVGYRPETEPIDFGVDWYTFKVKVMKM